MRRSRRLLYALTPAVLILLIAVSPAVQRHDAAHRVALVGTASIRDVDSSLASLSAGVAERVPVASIAPMQGTPTTGVAALALISWIVVVLAAAFTIARVVHTRRDRAPPAPLRHALS